MVFIYIKKNLLQNWYIELFGIQNEIRKYFRKSS
jgi:hypothetical protein